MCGIVGYSGSFDAGLLPKMSCSVAHRGPDDRGQWVDGSAGVGLAHRRLSIIDLSPEGRQPMTNENGTLQLIYNGEIYNYQELRREMVDKGHVFRSRTDTEVLVHLYEEEGAGMLSRLNGIFSFALWDGREGKLLLARDGLGVKPLYYAQTASGFLFASELKALLLCTEVSRELDPVAIHHLLAYLWTPAPRTVLKGVSKLPPGCAMEVRDGRLARQWRYYDLPYGGERISGGEDEIADGLRQRLLEAVERQMVSDVPVGAFLSGGLDSSAVVAMMRRAYPDSVARCYSIGFSQGVDPSKMRRGVEGSPADLPYARRVAEHLGVDLCPIVVKADIIRHLERMLYHLDEPQADPAPINALLIAEQAREDGYKVLLSGAGGDDMFSGYRRHWALKMERMWGWIPRTVRQGMAGLSNSGRLGRPLPRRVRRAFAYAGMSPDDRLMSYFYWTSDQVRRNLYTSDFSDHVRDVDTAEPLRASLERIPGEIDPLNRMLYLECKHFLADHNLNYTDKMGMAAGVEVRVPLLDLELIDYAVRIPPGLKQRGRVGKYIFKKAMEPYLPRDVIYRPKSGFGAPVRRWLRHELKDMVDDVLSADSLRRRGLFEPRAVQALVRQDREGRIDAAYTIFALMCMELWCRIFVDVEPVGGSSHSG